jgi:hypothetical protein
MAKSFKIDGRTIGVSKKVAKFKAEADTLGLTVSEYAVKCFAEAEKQRREKAEKRPQ